jgi:hypothetical protein
MDQTIDVTGRTGFMGRDGFIWWIGVVEDNNDPLQLSRARVRIFGWHTEDLSQLPTEHLPWAIPLIPIGHSDTPKPQHGDWVAGFFLDGEYGQEPIMMGMLPGHRSRGPKQIFGGSVS